MHRTWPWALLLLACSPGCGDPIQVGTYPKDIADDAELSALALSVYGRWIAREHPAELIFTRTTQDGPRAGTYEFHCAPSDCAPVIDLIEAAHTAGFEDPRLGKFQLLTRLPAENWLKADCVLIPGELSPFAWRVQIWLHDDGKSLRVLQPLDGTFADFVRQEE